MTIGNAQRRYCSFTTLFVAKKTNRRDRQPYKGIVSGFDQVDILRKTRRTTAMRVTWEIVEIREDSRPSIQRPRKTVRPVGFGK
jgi:hypothetical protein